MGAASLPPNPLRASGVLLYNPDHHHEERGVDVAEFSRYINAVAAAGDDVFRQFSAPEDLAVVVGIRTGSRSRVWLITAHPQDDPWLLKLKRSLESVPAPRISSGSIAFAYMNQKRRAGDWPFPEEWSAIPIAEGRSMSVDEIIDRVWPDQETSWWRRLGRR